MRGERIKRICPRFSHAHRNALREKLFGIARWWLYVNRNRRIWNTRSAACGIRASERFSEITTRHRQPNARVATSTLFRECLHAKLHRFTERFDAQLIEQLERACTFFESSQMLFEAQHRAAARHHRFEKPNSMLKTAVEIADARILWFDKLPVDPDLHRRNLNDSPRRLLQ